MSVTSATVLNAQSLNHWRKNPINFIESVLNNPETGQPFELLPAERQFLEHAFKIGPNGKLLYNEWLYSCPKKSGKTTFAALIIITMILLYGGSFPEAFALANDQEQAQSRVFEFIKRIILTSSLLKDEAQITQYKITFPAFNATIQAIASDAGSAAGANPVISCFDELWAYTSERSRRLFDEMNVPPTRKIACRLTVTYAGYEGESTLLEELYKRGKEQPLVGTDLYAGDGLLMFWSHKPIAHWQDEAWATSMRRERASAYQRQFLNEFATSSSSFIDMNKWDACVDERLGSVPVNLFLKVWIGVDGSFKHDQTALVAVTFDTQSQRFRLVRHAVFQPTPEERIDFEATVETTLRDWCRKYQVRQILYDPYQLQAVAQRLIKDRLPMEEFPQTSGNLTAASQCLYELINSGNLLVYPDQAMRKAISQAVAKETPRGWRITKQTSSHKIDLVAALSFACYGCIQGQATPSFSLEQMLANERPQTSDQAKQAEAERNAFWRRRQYWNSILHAPNMHHADGTINYDAMPRADPFR